MFPVVLSILQKKPLGIMALYKEVRPNIQDINEFIDILDSLYALNKIDYDEIKEVLYYVI